MTRLVVTDSEHVPRTPDGHAVLIVQPDVPAVHADTPDGWATHAETALTVAGILARVAMTVTDTMTITGQAHGCNRQVWPDDEAEPGAEIVHGMQSGGCGAYLLTGEDHILDGGRMPSLVAHVPPNRQRAWTQHLAAVVEQIIDGDRRSIETTPAIE